MSWKEVFQLGLPLGSTFLVISIIDLIFLMVGIVREFGEFLYHYFQFGSGEVFTHFELFMTITSSIWSMIATIGFLWIGSVFKGNRKMLLVWIISTSVLSAIFVLLFIVHSISTANKAAAVYILLTMTLTHIYQIAVAFCVYLAMKQGDVIQPIGKGVVYIWEYFSNDLEAAAKFFLVSEMVIDAHYLITRQFVTQVLGQWWLDTVVRITDENAHPAIITEQLIMTAIRLVSDSVCLYFLTKENRKVVQGWCLFTSLQILISTGIFVLLTVVWRAEDITDTVTVLLMFPVHLLYRCVVLYFCLRYTRVQFTNTIL